MLVFAHGAGRSGTSAWPSQQRPDAVHPDLSAADPRSSAAVADAAVDDSVVVAHSHGAIAAVLSLAHGARPRAFVLAEPALYDVARGIEAIERHIAIVERARRALASDDLFAYWRIIRPLMFGGPADATTWPDEREAAERFATVEPPWGFGIAASDVVVVPTIVVTGAWSAEYEAIADALEHAGAERDVLEGRGHRPQDDPAFDAILERVLSG